MPNRSLFPVTGFIVEKVAAGFLYITDSSVSIIDCYISNPKADLKSRSNALDAITRALITCAKEYDTKVLKCDTQLEAIKSRAVKHGFKPVGSFDAFAMEL